MHRRSSSELACRFRSPASGRPQHRLATPPKRAARRPGFRPSRTRLRRPGARVESQARSVRISRANPFSEVTDRFCRLPLSALFDIGQRLLASETCCGRSVRARMRFNCTCPDYHGTAGRHRTTPSTDVAFRPRLLALLCHMVNLSLVIASRS